MNPHRLKPYIRAKQLRNEEADKAAWQVGLYVHRAIVSVLPAPKGQKRVEYPKKPFLNGYSRDHDENGELTEEAARRREIAQLHRLEIARFNAELKQRAKSLSGM